MENKETKLLQLSTTTLKIQWKASLFIVGFLYKQNEKVIKNSSANKT